MTKKTLIAGGVCLLAVFLFLAVTACMPATPVSSQELASFSDPEADIATDPEEELPVVTEMPLAEAEMPELPTASPTSLPKPPATMEVAATARSAISLGDLRTVSEAGFSFRPVIGYSLHMKADQATMVNKDGTIILSMSGVKVDSVGALEDRIEQLLSGVEEGMEAFEASTPYNIKVGDRSGLAADVTGKMSGEPVAGQVAMIAASDARLFYFVALIVEQPGQEEQLSEGDQAIEAVIDSVTFVDPNLQ